MTKQRPNESYSQFLARIQQEFVKASCLMQVAADAADAGSESAHVAETCRVAAEIVFDCQEALEVFAPSFLRKDEMARLIEEARA